MSTTILDPTDERVPVRRQLAARPEEVTARPARELLRDEFCAEGLTPAQAERIGLDTLVPKFRSKEMITLVVAGGEAGKFAACLGGWVSGPMGSQMTTVEVGE